MFCTSLRITGHGIHSLYIQIYYCKVTLYESRRTVIHYILWHVNPFLGNARETNNQTTARKQ
jgi:hypothetical protein